MNRFVLSIFWIFFAAILLFYFSDSLGIRLPVEAFHALWILGFVFVTIMNLLAVPAAARWLQRVFRPQGLDGQNSNRGETERKATDRPL